MSAERYAFVSVEDKDKLDLIARGLVSQEHHIVSLGGSATEIRAARVHVIDVLDFLGASQQSLGIGPHADEREWREVIASHMGQRMGKPRAVLAAQGREAIDLTYITLRPPKVLVDEEGQYAGIKNDKGGEFMIRASIEGGRNILTGPEQMADFLDAPQDSDSATRRLTLGIEAFAYLQRYTAEAMLLGKLSLRDAT